MLQAELLCGRRVMSADLQEELSEADMSDEWKICKNGDAEAPLFCNIICKSYKYIFLLYHHIYDHRGPSASWAQRPASSCHGVATRQPGGAHAPKGHPPGLKPLEQGSGPCYIARYNVRRIHRHTLYRTLLHTLSWYNIYIFYVKRGVFVMT